MQGVHFRKPICHDLPHRPEIRAQVYRTTPEHWWWSYESEKHGSQLRHGPFRTQPEAFASAFRMVEAL